MSPSCSRQQWKICLGVHIHAFPRELFIEDVRRLSEDYTGEARSWNFSANTWAEDLCAHLCTHQRRTTLLPGWLALHKQTINSPSGLLKFREYLNVCNIYCADLQIWKWSVRQNTHTHTHKKKGPWTVEVERFVLSGSVYVHARLEKWPGKPQE